MAKELSFSGFFSGAYGDFKGTEKLFGPREDLPQKVISPRRIKDVEYGDVFRIVDEAPSPEEVLILREDELLDG